MRTRRSDGATILNVVARHCLPATRGGRTADEVARRAARGDTRYDVAATFRNPLDSCLRSSSLRSPPTAHAPPPTCDRPNATTATTLRANDDRLSAPIFSPVSESHFLFLLARGGVARRFERRTAAHTHAHMHSQARDLPRCWSVYLYRTCARIRAIITEITWRRLRCTRGSVRYLAAANSRN